MKVSCSIDIDSSPKSVFRWIASPEKAREWMSSVSKTEMIHETAGMLGTTFRETVEEGGKGLEMQGIVTGYEPDKSISFHLSSRIHVIDVEHCIEKTGDGVRLTQNATIRWKFPMNLISLVIGAKIRDGIMNQAREELGKLKELCESNTQV